MTRMWLGVDPSEMCRQHLLGEHAEIHQFQGTVQSGRVAVALGQWRKGNVTLWPDVIKERHERLVAEMQARGYNHASPLGDGLADALAATRAAHDAPIPEGEDRIEHAVNRDDLARRCSDCRERMDPAPGFG